MEQELGIKGRPARIWQVYEKEIVLEHMTKNREKLGLTRDELAMKRNLITSSDSQQFQILISEIYTEDNNRRSLLNFVAKINRMKEGEPKHSMLGVTSETKARFMALKSDDLHVSEFLEQLLDLYEKKKK